jgi:NAD dependent epimerase/dehydratase
MRVRGETILVTGADGFIGSHLVEELVHRGAAVRAFVLYNSFNSWGWLEDVAQEVKEAVEIVPGDVRDVHSLRSAASGCRLILHLAALIAIPYSYRSPDSYLSVNVQGTLNLLQAARECRTERVIVTSTSEVYGTARQVPIGEDHPLQAQSPYAASKIGADQMAVAFHRTYGMPVTVVRPFNTYGPRQSARAVIPTVITQALSGRKTIRLGNIHPTRDLVFVRDTVEGIIRLAETPGIEGEQVNIATGHEITIGELAREICRQVDPEAVVVTDPERVRPNGSEVDRLVGDSSTLRRLTGWSPSTPLADGIAKTLEWFRRPENLARYKADIYNQ